ncbi:alpha-N-arabinofuranosidase [Bifidobacterium leontopitheci]|uniref:non-reducing end alpha-L-arabinofuranosidase n=1 Tax=Bifidobacterium leontopitheci TaxID=2650774 RepID=A0A6I1GJW7_9BIFI|nr:alpha-L-arabinofuranosidase C-terminal domain-containing protein [Bifidobacterium leontopitheci]KAB7789657.1 alpha-L-arabinofuranosidase [Bifidobacterium leontopitheci]
MPTTTEMKRFNTAGAAGIAAAGATAAAATSATPPSADATTADVTVTVGPTPLADVPPRLFGSFVEHLGRCVYGGLYEPGHPTADSNGFRRDVIELVKELGVTCVRYPGGNFVSGYRWEDGTGPREDRPVRRDLAWHCTETNQVGIDDFYRWSQAAGTEVMLAVNMGTRGLQEALDELEYVNGAPGTTLADRRVANGIPKPMGVRMWCIGNEMDGPWQIGHTSADEYAAAVDRVAHAMKLAEPGLELVACGSSSAQMPTFGEWERKVLTKAYANIDFVSCHAYYRDHGHVTRDAAAMQDFLASAQDMTRFIATVAAQADAAKAANGGERDIKISFDEWGVWYADVWNAQEDRRMADSASGLHTDPWPVAPPLLEDVYTVADAVVEGSLMITLLKHCDRVRSASRAQLVNVIAPIMTVPGGPAWRQTTFYPFAEAAGRARGDVFVPRIDSPLVHTATYGEVPAVDAVVTWDAATRRGLLLAVNRDLARAHDVAVALAGLTAGAAGDGSAATGGGADAGVSAAAGDGADASASADRTVAGGGMAAGSAAGAHLAVVRTQLLHDDDIYRQNTAEEPDAVTPDDLPVQMDPATASMSFTLPPVSWAAVEFAM